MPFELPAWPPDWPQIRTAVEAALASGDWGAYHSQLVNALAARICHQFRVPHCQLTCSGTAAIELALRAARVGPGSEVLLAAYDFPGNFRTVELLGATPVLVDVAADSPCMDVSQLETAASDKVVAVIASHLYGRAAPVESLRQICDDHGWVLIEDACQVPGMIIKDRPAGSFGDFGALSFGGSKPITAGAGGALLATNDRLAARLPALIHRPSDTFALSPLQAAVIPPQLDRLEELNRRREAAASFLQQELTDVEWLGRQDEDVQPAFYKLAWKGVVPSSSPLPIGSGFRSTAAVSERRCRKPVSLDRSVELAQSCVLLDHRALLVPPDRYSHLAEALRQT